MLFSPCVSHGLTYVLLYGFVLNVSVGDIRSGLKTVQIDLSLRLIHTFDGIITLAVHQLHLDPEVA